MKWTGPDDQPDDDVEDDDDLSGDGEAKDATRKFNPNNECHLVWQGTVIKRHFKGFVFQSCETADQARKVLNAKGVAHYWDQVVEYHFSKHSRGDNLLLRLAKEEEDGDDSASANKGNAKMEEDAA